jgi:hypothetical protein
MEGLRLRFRYFWIDQQAGIVGMMLCIAVASGLLGILAFINDLQLQDLSLSLTPRTVLSSEGTIIGFVGGSSKSDGPAISAYFRTREGNYGFVPLPFFSGCRNGDRLFLTQWEVRRRLRFRVRPPGCSRP